MRDGHLTHLSRFGSEIWFGSLSCGKSLAFFKWLNPFTVLISGLSVGYLPPDLLYLLESFPPSVPAIFPAVGCHIQHSVLLGLLCWTLGDMIFLFSPNVMYHQLLWMQNHRSSLSSSSYAFFTSTKTQWSSFVLYISTLKANNTSVVLKHEAILHLTDHQLSSSTKLQQPVTPQRLRSLPLYPLSIKNHSLFSDIQGF